ncbi:MAG TPA: hypothetical protein VGG75_37460 [Trebonia sp.]|jgi:hypothetical protein
MRRHLLGIALAIVTTAVMFFAGSWGYVQLLRLPVSTTAPASALPAQGGSLLSNVSVLEALAAVGVTGLLIGLIVVLPRISPLASGLPGLLALAWTGLYLSNVSRALKLIPMKDHAFGAGLEALLFNGTLAGIGLAMIIPMLLPSRWRSADDGTRDSSLLGDDDVDQARTYVEGLKESMASANPPRPPEVRGEAGGLAGSRTGGMPRVGSATGSMPRVGSSTESMTRVSDEDMVLNAEGIRQSPSGARSPGAPSRTGLVGSGPVDDGSRRRRGRR